MKKSIFKTSLFILLSGLVFLGIGCENFASGSDFVEEVNSKIDYENAPRFSVTVAPDNTQYGVVTSSSYIGECRVTDTISLGFTSSTDYYFTHWIVRVGNEIDSTGKYIAIENSEKASTTAKLKNTPPAGEEFKIVPVCELRPRISSIKPDTEDEFRDAPIKVRFTQNISKYSIYYTDSELSGLSGYSLLSENGNTYGYIKDGVTYFKNIKITNESTGESILQHYKMPYIESGKTLVIPAKTNAEAPKAGAGISIDISNNMFYSKNGYNIPLLTSQTGYYGTNTSIDNVPPEISIQAPVLSGDAAISFTAVANTVRAYGAKFDYDSNRESDKLTSISASVSTTALDKSNLNEETALKSYVRDRKIYIKALVNDTGSKPDFFGMKVERLDSYLSGPAVYPELIKLPISVSGPNGKFTDVNEDYAGVIDFSDTATYPDGIYKIIFVAKDKNGNTAYDVNDTNHRSEVENLNTYGNYYYFVFDNTSPSLPARPTFKTYETYINTCWQIPAATTDYKTVVIQYKKAADSNYSAPVSGILNTTKQLTFGKSGTNTLTETYCGISLDLGEFYNLKIYATDWYGNDSAAYEYKETTYPKQITIDLVTGNAYTGTSVTTTWSKPASGEYSGANIYYDVDGTANPTTSVTAVAKEGTQTCTISGLTTGTTYIVCPRPYISYYDGYSTCQIINNNTSQDKKIDINPASVTNFNVTVNSATKVTLNWTNPTGNYTGLRIYKKLSSQADSDYVLVDTITDKTSTSKEIDSGLTAGQSHDFKVVTYATLQAERTTDSPVVSKLVTPAPPANIVITQNSANRTTAHDLSWTAAAGNVDGYMVYYDSVMARAYARATFSKDVDDASTSTTIDALSPGTTYYYSVASYVIVNGEKIYSDRVGTYSDVPCLVTRPEACCVFHNLALGQASYETSFKFAVSRSGTYTGYAVYYKKNTDSDFVMHPGTSSALAYTITGLEPGTDYDVKLVTYVGTFDQTAYENGTSINTNDSDILTKGTKPYATTNLQVTDTTSTSATITWTNPATNYTGVRIYKKLTTNSNYPSSYVEKTDGGSTYTFTNLTPGYSYDFKVVTFFNAKNINPYNSTNSTINKECTTPQSVSTYIRPNGATGVNLAKNSSAPTTSIDVNWTNPTGQFNGSSIFYNTTSSLASATRFTNVGNTQTSTTITGLTAGTTYYVWVIPFAGPADNSPEAAVKAGTCLSCATGATSESLVTTPDNITNLTVTNTTQTDITISYTKPSGGVSGYAIYKKDLTKANDSYSLAGRTTSTSYTISSLTAGHKYSIYVKTYSIEQENESSGCTEITQYTRPRSLKPCSVETESSTSIRYNWDWEDADSDGSQGITGIIVLYGTSNNVANATYKTWWKPSETQRSATIDGLSPNTTYYVWLYSYVGDSTVGNMSSTLTTAAKAGGNRLDSSFAMNGTSVKTAPNAPTNLKATTVATGGKINLTWTAPTNGCGGYKLVYGTTSSPATVLSENISSSATSYTFSAASNKKYYFKLYSYNGTWSDTSAKNVNSTSVVGPTNIKPMYPVNLGYTVPASGATNEFTTVQFTWDNPTGYDYSSIQYAISSTNSIASSNYCGWCYANGTSGYEGRPSWTLTQGTRYYAWLGVAKDGTDWAGIKSGTDGSNYNPTPLTFYTKPEYNKYVLGSSWNITSTSSGMKFDWQYVSDTTSRSKDYTYLSFWIGTSSDFTKAKKIDWWNYDQYSTTTTKTYATPASTTLSKNTTYYFWYTVTVGKNPSTVADITDANSYTSGYKSVKALY